MRVLTRGLATRTRVPRRRLAIVIVTPVPRGSRQGNRITAERWARILRGLGHRAAVRQTWKGERCDVLIALHARKSAGSALRFARAHPDRPLIVGLAGTDIHPGVDGSVVALAALASATRLVALQPLAIQQLPQEHRAKARVVLQSAESPRQRATRRRDVFEIAVIGHLRPVKDPFRAALAARLLPASSNVRIVHAGAALTETMQVRARHEEARNPRYRWHGDLRHRRVLTLLARCRAVVVSSWSEGGANVLSEALVSGTAVLASRVSGNVGILGADYPAYFDAGSTEALAALIERYENDTAFRRSVVAKCRQLGRSFQAGTERASWKDLLDEIARVR